MLKLRRNDSGCPGKAACPHCRQDSAHQRQAHHVLPCGHRYCTYGLSELVHSRPTKPGSSPTCCGQALPPRLVELALSHGIAGTLVSPKLQPGDTANLVAQRIGPVGEALEGKRDSVQSTVEASAPTSSSPAPETSLVHQHPQFLELKDKQARLDERLIAWTETQRARLQQTHERLRADIKARHEIAVDDLHETHGAAMADAEDKQVKAEADLRELHLQERRDNATALKHMEAYCAGTYSSGEAHGRTVTDQDLLELEKARRTRDVMDTKHSNAINVLRGEQGRRIKLRAQRQERVVQDLKRAQRSEELEFERKCTSELLAIDTSKAKRQKRILTRWELQVAILTKQVELGMLDQKISATQNQRHGETSTSDALVQSPTSVQAVTHVPVETEKSASIAVNG
jgi:hypothetical protein